MRRPSCGYTQRFPQDRSDYGSDFREVILCDEVLSAAVLHHLTVMGEAINRLSPELRERHSEVPWHQIVAVRHRIVHAYFDLDWQILWNAAMDDVPQLRKQISGILEREFPESELT